jgi:protein-S-isoprenylcysteine O-methyltransferase Ste14
MDAGGGCCPASLLSSAVHRPGNDDNGRAFVIAFWAAPTMTIGHLLFAAVTAAYIFVGILLEERDLVDLFGDDYRRYRDRVSMLVPWRKSA